MNTELFNLEGKTAIVTGGGNGIGRACCLMLSDFGANVVVAELISEDAQKVAEEIDEKGLMEQETAYLRLLDKAQTATVENNQLTIKTDDGDLVFEAAKNSAANN